MIPREIKVWYGIQLPEPWVQEIATVQERAVDLGISAITDQDGAIIGLGTLLYQAPAGWERREVSWDMLEATAESVKLLTIAALDGIGIAHETKIHMIEA